MAEQETKHADDFAKIVRASNGRQVLFFKSTDDDENALHAMVCLNGGYSDMAFAGLPDDAFETCIEKADQTMADQVMGQSLDLGLLGED